MPALIEYIVKLSISLAVVWLFYQFVLRKLTFYNSNRWYLLGYSMVCFFIPFINVSSVVEGGQLNDNRIIQLIPAIETYTRKIETVTDCPVPVMAATWDKSDWMLLIVAAGVVFLLLRFLIRCISFWQLKRKAKLISDNGMKLYQVDEAIIPFSFGNAIFINRAQHSEEELQEIIHHEFIHVKQRHSIDIIWAEILCMLNWYNPFAWLLKADIRQNLEFIADNKVLENGINKKQYQYLLLKVIGNKHFSIAQQFNFSSLKKRIAMMNKNRSARVHLLRFLFMLPLLAVVLVSFRKQIGDTLRGPDPIDKIAPLDHVTDTVPSQKIPNSKGYYIDIIGVGGDCTVVVKDKDKKEVTRLLLTDWDKKENYYEGLYGNIPPPPAPEPPSASDLPSQVQWMQAANPNVRSVVTENNIATVTLKDGKKEKYDLSKSAELEKYEKKYGKMLTPPVPPDPASAGMPPAPPTPPTPVSDEEVSGLSDFLRRNPEVEKIGYVFNRDNSVAIYHLVMKNGAEEKFDMRKDGERKKAADKYGDFPIPSTTPPPVAPVPPVRSFTSSATPEATGSNSGSNLLKVSSEFEITDKKATIKLKNGKLENYDLTNKAQRAAFEEKYGKLINVSTTVNTSMMTSVNANMSVVTGINTNVNGVTTTSKNFNTVVSPVSATTSVSTGSNINSVVAPAALRSTTSGVQAINPSPTAVGGLVNVIDDRSYIITGNEDIIITITNKTTRPELEKFIAQMKEKSIDLSFEEIEHNENGLLVKISGTMRSNDGSKSNFVVTDFKKLVLAMMKKDGKTYFKVNTGKKEVI